MAGIRLNLQERAPVHALSLVLLLTGATGLGSLIVARNHLQADIDSQQSREDHLARLARLDVQSRPVQTGVEDDKAAATITRVSHDLTIPDARAAAACARSLPGAVARWGCIRNVRRPVRPPVP